MKFGTPHDITNLFSSLCGQHIGPDSFSFEALGVGKGAYVLLIELSEKVPLKRPAGGAILAPGTYLYVGSANGPGGMRARLKRHFKRDKKIHWHVDQLTTRAESVEAFAVAGGCECALGDLLIKSGCFEVAVPGFGSSDCPHCASHLFAPVGSHAAE